MRGNQPGFRSRWSHIGHVFIPQLFLKTPAPEGPSIVQLFHILLLKSGINQCAFLECLRQRYRSPFSLISDFDEPLQYAGSSMELAYRICISTRDHPIP